MTFIVAVVARPASAARELPTVDAFARVPPSGSEPSARERAKGVDVVHEEPRLGVPTFVWGVRPAQASAKSLQPATPEQAEQAARKYLDQQAGLYRLGSTDAPHLPVKDVHRTRKGASIVTFGQEVEGIEVFRQSLKVLLDSDSQLVAMSGYLSPVASTSRFDKSAPAFTLEPREAIALAWKDLHGDLLPAVSLTPTGRAQGAYSHYALTPGPRTVVFSSPARVKRVFFPLPDVLVPAYYVELDTTPVTSTDGDRYAYVISAADGQVLYRHDLSSHQSYTYRVWADTQSPYLPHDGPQGTAGSPHPTGLPDGYQAPFVAPNLVTLRNAPFSRNDPWLPAGATQTTGNNVEAYADLASPDGFGPGDLRGTLGGSGVFGDGYDFTLAPSATDAQQTSPVVQLFYVTNFLHDWFYDSGFDEAAGNAQADNHGRGGIEGDSLLAESQDFLGRNGPNMSTPADGARPRMELQVFDTRGVRAADVFGETMMGRYKLGGATFGPQQFNVLGFVVMAQDGVAGPGGSTTDACEPLTNAAAVAGEIALANRGGCDYTVQAATAQAAGALALVIANDGFNLPEFEMYGRDPSITIPVVSVSYGVGSSLARSSKNTNVTLIRQGADRDGALDNTLVAHEWAHYMSSRLVGDANGLTNNQGRSLGEGWSDFAALLMMVREGDAQSFSNDDWSGVYAQGAHVDSGGENQGYYWGSRRYPYSTNPRKNPLTFRHLQKNVALPGDIPVSFGSFGNTNAEIHSSGEVWAVMLWECYAALLRDKQRLTFAQAQQRMKDYLVASMKLTPNAPTFLEARDALLAVAYTQDTADYLLFARAFAKRGAGSRAVAPPRDSTDHAGVVESFDIGKDVVLVSAEVVEQVGTTASCDDDGALDTGETALVRMTFRNNGIARLTQTSVTLSSDIANLSFPQGATVSVPPTDPLELVTLEVPIRLSGPATPGILHLTLTYRDAEQTFPKDQKQMLVLRVNTDELPGTGTVETGDTLSSPWLRVASPGALPWTREQALNDPNGFFHGPDKDGVSDISLVSPPLQLSATAAFRFTFQHRFLFESGDGGILELSEDDGATWTDLGEFLNPRPNGYVSESEGNPIGGRMAYNVQSERYPAFIPVVADLGTAHAGKTVRIRFRIGTDRTVGEKGWDVDDIRFEGLVNTPFTTFVPHLGQCINRAPVANAGPSQTLSEGRQVTLSGSGMDPEGAALTYAWTQTAGPQVVLSSTSVPAPTFTAPEVTQATDLTFELRVNDGVSTSAPSAVTVRVRNFTAGNQAPVAGASPAAPVNKGTRVTLVGSGTDPEGVALTYAWTQVGGPAVTLTDATAPSAGFMAPQVDSDTELSFQLVVSDGELDSAPVVVTVLVWGTFNALPVAQAGEDPSVDEGAQVTLSGEGSTDPDGTALTYAWTQVDGPAVDLTVDGANATFTAPSVDGDTELSFQLEVTDARGGLSEDTVKVRVADVPAQDTGCGCSAGQEGSVPGAVVMLLAALGFAMRRPRARAVAVPKH
ncbi:myxosortase-dependent M36 family metallopeptidase [Pyxidicoccus sp. MSG2]|uniref:myxosortase-dependent M36 family metallopeptidase n=1 Tax=Pyxidicoccus sp. MSG2 TaxID=2996790 RepID=UPI0022713F7F|nr:myxosortase-dependent M36 family metallopeptidase [Pyxidicoccus sp. MSG2]MCY1020154.1 myxosortase-dependent M36 family metallopeptidase [Pyxidicoccus sp. MSG2]